MANRYINAAVSLTTASTTDVYTVPNGCSALLQSVVAANLHASQTQVVTAQFYDSSVIAEYSLIQDASVPAASSLNLLDRPFALEEGDILRLTAGAGGVIDVTASILLVDATTSVPVGTITTAALADGSVTAAKLSVGDLGYQIKLFGEVFG